MSKKLYRSNTNKTISGVCGGIAEYFNIDPTLVRIGTIILMLATAIFPLLLGYIICIIIIPERPYELEEGEYEPTNFNSENAKKFIGIGFIVLGCFLLLDRFVWWIDKGAFWGVLVIILGVFFIYTGFNKKEK